MKRIFLICFVMIAAVTVCFAMGEADQTSVNKEAVESKNTEDIYNTAIKANAMVPVPQVEFFVERDTLARWVERWDKPSVVTYVYLFSYGTCIGYYVCNGKPAATTNYLIPEYQTGKMYSGDGGSNPYQIQTMDLDGTYGANNSGIRFFTASGIAVEWSGQYLYSDAKLPLNITLLGE